MSPDLARCSVCEVSTRANKLERGTGELNQSLRRHGLEYLWLV